jgi:hypothetical protein
MATNAERQRNFKARMYAAGYKQVQTWAPRNPEANTSKMGRDRFLKQIDELMKGLNKSRQAMLYAELIRYLEFRKGGSQEERK